MRAEHDDKLERLTRVAHAAGVDGILLAAHHNIAWLTGGRHNRVDGSRETGSARLLVTAAGRRFVLANAIEMPRLLDEVLAGLDYSPVEYHIARAIADAAAGFRARAVVALVGADDRLRKYRHPVPTAAAWKHVVMLALCAERDGLIVSLSRLVAAGPPADLDPRTRAAA